MHTFACITRVRNVSFLGHLHNKLIIPKLFNINLLFQHPMNSVSGKIATIVKQEFAKNVFQKF